MRLRHNYYFDSDRVSEAADAVELHPEAGPPVQCGANTERAAGEPGKPGNARQQA